MHRRIALSAILGLVVAILAAPSWAVRLGTKPAAPGCTISGTDGDDTLRGTGGADVICALDGDDFVKGRGGDDVILLGKGTDGFDAGRGDDVVRGGAGQDYGFGGPGNDRISLQGGNDLIVSDAQGRDTLYGGPGDDSCLSAFDDRGGDIIDGGDGYDIYGADPGDTVSAVEEGPTHCEGG